MRALGRVVAAVVAVTVTAFPTVAAAEELPGDLDPAPVEEKDPSSESTTTTTVPVAPERPVLSEDDPDPAPTTTTTTAPEGPQVTTTTTAPPSAELTIDASTLPLVSTQLEVASKNIASLDAKIRRLDGQVLAAQLNLTQATARVVALEERLKSFSAAESEAVARLAAATEQLHETAVAAFVSGSQQPGVLWAAKDPNDLAARQVIVGVVGEHRSQVTEEFVRLRAQAGSRVREAADALTEAVESERVAARQLETLQAELADVVAERADVDLTVVTRLRPAAVVADLDIPVVAVDAYVRAAQSAPCALPWWLLAGVGKVESNHGRYRGRALLVDGTTSPPIIGIPLNGTNGTARILDTDGGVMDFDPVYDRAVGPMQFIPSTWARWGRDVNGDGVRDPHNLYDAAGAAAAYLCASGRDVISADGVLLDEPVRAALWSYNRSVPYADKVISHGLAYSKLTVTTRDGIKIGPPADPSAAAAKNEPGSGDSS